MRSTMSVFSLVTFLVFLPGSAAPGAEEATLSEHFAPLKPIVGKTWRGEFKKSTKEKPLYDVSRWEVALKGKAIRILHSVNDGVYGGESIIMWNAEKKSLESFYFTNAGFFTQSLIEFKDGHFVSREKVVGNAQGVTEVEATTQLLPDGKMHVKSRYLKGTEWVDGHEITYSEAPDAKVKVD